MLTARVIPCLDVKDGRIVKGVRFSNLREAGEPAERAALYEAQGADEIVILDINATVESRANRVETVRAVRERLSIPLTVGGGVRSVADARALLESGADKVALNTAAVDQPDLVGDFAGRFGRQCVVVAIDAARDDANGWVVVTRAGSDRQRINAIAWAREVERLGAGEILLTSWDRDGTGEGYDLDLLKAVCSVVSIPMIASGGASRPEHLAEAHKAGASAALAATVFHDNQWTVEQVKAILRIAGLEVRT